GRQLVVVTGKGGVGKSTVAAALGLVAARRGLRTIIAEVARRGHVSQALGGEGVHEAELAPRPHPLALDPAHAMGPRRAPPPPARARWRRRPTAPRPGRRATPTLAPALSAASCSACAAARAPRWPRCRSPSRTALRESRAWPARWSARCEGAPGRQAHRRLRG